MNFKKIALASVILVFTSFPVFSATLDEAIDLYKKSEFYKSIDILNALAKKDPENPEFHLWLSKCYEGTFDLEKSLQENRIYQTLQNKKLKKAVDKEQIINPIKNNDKNDTEDTTTDNDSQGKDVELTSINNDFLDKVIAQRDPANESSNKKYFNKDKIKKIISALPSNTDDIDKIKKTMELKNKYHLSTHEDTILLSRANIYITQLNVDIKRFEISQEKNEKLKKDKEAELDSLIKLYSSQLSEFTKILNTPVYPNTDQTSYEYFGYLNPDQDLYMKAVTENKKQMADNLIKIDQTLKELKNSVIKNQKEIEKLNIDDALLKANTKSLADFDKDRLNKYLLLTAKLKEDKNSILDLLEEEDILFKAFQNINNTIKKIDPSYKFNDPVLPKQEVLKEISPSNDNQKEQKK